MPLRDGAHVSSLKTAVVQRLQTIFGAEHVAVTYGFETKYKRIQILKLPKSHTNDAVAIACAMGEGVERCDAIHLLRCVSRGQYQLFNGKQSEHKTWAPRKVKGWKSYEMVTAKGVPGYIGGRRLKGSFVLKDVATGKTILEVAPGKLQRIARCTHGWITTTTASNQREGGASSPGSSRGAPAPQIRG